MSNADEGRPVRPHRSGGSGIKPRQELGTCGVPYWQNSSEPGECPSCKGTGDNPIRAGFKCFDCNGTGKSDISSPSFYEREALQEKIENESPVAANTCPELSLSHLEAAACGIRARLRPQEAFEHGNGIRRALSQPCPNVVQSGESRYCTLAESGAAPEDELSARLHRAEELLREAQKALPRMGENDVIPGGGLPSQTETGERIDAFLKKPGEA